MYGYKIRRRTDGLFSTGGDNPEFIVNGKIWKQIGHIKNHLNLIFKEAKDLYNDCDLVTFEYVIIQELPMTKFVENYIEKKNRKDKLIEKSNKDFWKEERRKQFLKLKQEFGK